MSLYERIFSALSPVVGGRAYPDQAPANVARPYVVFAEVSETGSYTLRRGRAAAYRTRIQVDLYDDDSKPMAQFETLRERVRTAVENEGGLVVGSDRTREYDTKLRRAMFDFALMGPT